MTSKADVLFRRTLQLRRRDRSGEKFSASIKGKKMKRFALFGLTTLVACNVLPSVFPLEEPEGSAVIGGMADVRPLFGKTIRPLTSEEVGAFMLATCGCGDWRVLMQNNDGTQYQFPVHFFATGTYAPTGPVTVFGREESKAALGQVDQDDGVVSGHLDLNGERLGFSAQRGDSHALEIQACVLCHAGDNPISPRPPTHPVYVPGVTDCFSCHTVTID